MKCCAVRRDICRLCVSFHQMVAEFQRLSSKQMLVHAAISRNVDAYFRKFEFSDDERKWSCNSLTWHLVVNIHAGIRKCENAVSGPRPRGCTAKSSWPVMCECSSFANGGLIPEVEQAFKKRILVKPDRTLIYPVKHGKTKRSRCTTNT